MAPHRRSHHSKKPRRVAAHSTYQAKLGYPDVGRYRRTPPGTPTVADLIHAGDIVRTSYGTGGVVIAVNELSFTAPTGEALSHFTIVFVPLDRYGRHRDSDLRWLHECVAVDGRILMLFEINSDEVFVVDHARPTSAPPVRSILLSD